MAGVRWVEGESSGEVFQAEPTAWASAWQAEAALSQRQRNGRSGEGKKGDRIGRS